MNSVVSVVVFFIINVVTLVSNVRDKSSPPTPTFYQYLMEGFPIYALLSALLKMAFYKMGFPDPEFPKNNSIFSWETQGIGIDLTYMIGTGLVSFIILIIIERGGMQIVKSWTMKAIPRTLPQQTEEIDDDVQAEKSRIVSMSDNELKSQILVAQNVSKFYGQFLAVNQISFAVKRYDHHFIYQGLSSFKLIIILLFVYSQS